MTKQLSINLFLARAIYGNASYIHDFGAYECVNFVSSGDGKNDSDWDQFDPHTDKAQCMDVLLFAWRNDVVVDLEDLIPENHTDEQCMERLCKSIAIALGWREEA